LSSDDPQLPYAYNLHLFASKYGPVLSYILSKLRQPKVCTTMQLGFQIPICQIELH